MPIQRITSFKVPKPADVDFILGLYDTLKENQQKDGKPYILEVKARKLHEDPRNQGYTLVSMTKFASLQDMQYYDEQCQAHKDLKSAAVGKAVPPALIFYMDDE